MKTDEEQAKEYAEKEFPVKTDRTINYGNEVKHYPFIVGFKIGRELSDEKALRFAEWNKNNGYLFNRFSGKWYKNMLDDDCFTTEEIYTSKAFEDYLNGLKK